MADINVSTVPSRPDLEPQRPGGPAYDLIELLFFAYRDFIADPDALLAELGFGRAHHRVLHFVNRHPGMRVADLLDILKITKQSLGRVLSELVDDGFIEQRAGPADRRQRLLYLTPKGDALALDLANLQARRIARALHECGPESARGGAPLPDRHDRAIGACGGPGTDRARRPQPRPGALMTVEGTMARAPAPVPDDAPHLLVVDDDRRIRDLLSRYLGDHGFRVTTAGSAAEARQQLAGIAFDLLIARRDDAGRERLRARQVDPRGLAGADPDAHRALRSRRPHHRA